MLPDDDVTRAENPMARESSPDSGGAGADMELGDLKTERRNEIRAVMATVSTVPTNWHQVCSRLLLCCSCAEIQDSSRSSSATRLDQLLLPCRGDTQARVRARW